MESTDDDVHKLIWESLSTPDVSPVIFGMSFYRMSGADATLGINVSWAHSAKPWQPYVVFSLRMMIVQIGWCCRVQKRESTRGPRSSLV